EEAHLVGVLREGGYVRLSLVAEQGGQIVGHILFSDLPIVTGAGTVSSLALAPMAVVPECQNQGIGSALVRRRPESCQGHGHQIAIVVGPPHFSQRREISPDLAAPLESPFPGRGSFMAVELFPGALGGVTGRVVSPPPFGAWE